MMRQGPAPWSRPERVTAAVGQVQFFEPAQVVHAECGRLIAEFFYQ